MTPTELLYDEIIALSDTGQLKWHASSKPLPGPVVLHPERVCQQFEAIWQRGGKHWRLLFIEKRHREKLHPLFSRSNVHSYELLVLENGERLLKLDKWELSWGHLCALAATVRHSQTDQETERHSAHP